MILSSGKVLELSFSKKNTSKTPYIFFGTKTQPTPPSPFWSEHWNQNKPSWKQVHGTEIRFVTKTNENCGECDGLLTATSDIPLGVITADCVPILLLEHEHEQIAAIHAGWRGVKNQILTQFFNLKDRTFSTSNWVAILGPCIQACCFEVSTELAKDFLRFQNLYNLSSSKILPKYRHLDLQALLAGELKKLGLTQIHTLSECTKCYKETNKSGNEEYKYRSYRREGPESDARQLSMITMKALQNKSHSLDSL